MSYILTAANTLYFKIPNECINRKIKFQYYHSSNEPGFIFLAIILTDEEATLLKLLYPECPLKVQTEDVSLYEIINREFL